LPASADADSIVADNTPAGGPRARADVGTDADASADAAGRGADALDTHIVRLAESQWKASGIELQPVERDAFAVATRLTGKIALNQDRLAHIYPLVSGVVDRVYVTLGQTVAADDLLVVIHSRDVGQAKLELYQARM